MKWGFLHHLRELDSWPESLLIQGKDPDGSIQQIIDKVKRGESKIVTSALTLAEVIRPKQCDGLVANQKDRLLVSEAFRHDNILIVDLSEFIAKRAREIQWGLPGIKPNDAIHLATAEHAKVLRFETTDQKTITDRVQQHPEFTWLHNFQIGQPIELQLEIFADVSGQEED